MSNLINKILVPTDFSKSAYAAAQAAASLAKKLKAEILLLHVTDIQGYEAFRLEEDYQTITIEQMASKIVEDQMEALYSKPFLQEVKCTTSIKLGTVYKTIVEVAQEQNTDMIVMGTQGLTGFDKFLMGSNSEKVVRLAKVPVLTLKDSVDLSQVKNIAFASTFYDDAAISFPAIHQFIRLFEAKLHLLKVITPETFEPTYKSKKLIENFTSLLLLKDCSINIINSRTVVEGINSFCLENQIDLLTMATHGFEGFTHFLAGSITEQVGQKVSFPVLSMKTPSQRS